MSTLADRFIEALRAAPPGRALELLRDDEGFAAAVAFAPEALAQALAEAAAGAPADVAAGAFLCAACDDTGRVILADPGFTALGVDPQDIAAAVEARLSKGQRSAPASDRAGRPTALAVGAAAEAAGWPMTGPVRDLLRSGGASHCVLAFRPANDALLEVAAAYGLTGLETRVTAALLRHDDLRAAAAATGVAYETAREAIESAMRKAGARRQPDLVRKLTLTASGEMPQAGVGGEGWRALADMFELSPRQARVAWAVGHGATRAEAARAVGASQHAVKSDLQTVHLACGAMGAGLGRLIGEIDALTRLATATDIETPEPAPRRLRFVGRNRSPGRIAVEDHGPNDWPAVVVFHSTTNGRRLPGRLVRALHARRLRPISVERPGFGLTTPLPAAAAAMPLREAAEDLADVLDALGIARVRVLGRSCVAAQAFVAAYPELVEHGVLLGPTPTDPALRRRDGLFGAIAALVIERPALIEAFAGFFASGAKGRDIERLSRRTVQGCPADLAALDDPECLADHVRATRQAAIGVSGFARELAGNAEAEALSFSAFPWTIMIGAHDPLYTVTDERAWEATMPNATVVLIADGGRLLHLTHAERVAEAVAVYAASPSA